MGTFLDLSKESWETNSDLWQVIEVESGRLFQVVDNSAVDHVGGKVLYYKVKLINYRMRAEMRFLGHHLLEGVDGWFGFVMRARDTENYELVWFMPYAEGGKSAAYLSVAHGIVPWWTEAYVSQEKRGPRIQLKEWFEAQIEVLDDEFTGKSQEAPQLAVGRNGKRGFGGGSHHYGFFLGISPGISNEQAHEIR